MDQSDLDDAYNGFTYKDRKFTGVKDIISDLQWSLREDVWNISKENYDKKGVMNIKE